MDLNVTFPGNLAQVKTAALLRSVPTTTIAQGDLYLVNELEGVFYFDAGSVSVDDNATVIKPNDKTPLQAGRWLFQVGGLAAGQPGPAFPTYDTLSAFKGAPSANRTQALNASGVAYGIFNFETSRAPYTDDGVNTIVANDTPASAGAWVRSAVAANISPSILSSGGGLDIVSTQIIGGASVPPSRGNVHAYDYGTVGTYDILTNGTFTGSPATGWTLSNFTSSNPGLTHTAGQAASAKRQITVVDGQAYVIRVWITTTTAGTGTLFINGAAMVSNVDFFGLPVGAEYAYDFPYIARGVNTAIDLEFRSNVEWAGSISRVAVFAVQKEAPFDFFSISADKKDFSNPQGIKLGRYLAGNQAFGDRATLGNASGNAAWNIAIGARALSVGTDFIENTGVGSFAGEYYQGNQATFVGYSAGRLQKNGQFLTLIGHKAGGSSNGNRLTMVGWQVGLQNSVGNDLTFMGYQAGYAAKGSALTFIGSQAGQQRNGGNSNVDVGAVTGPYTPTSTNLFNYSQQTLVGSESKGYGDNATTLGFQARVGTDTYTGGAVATNATAIGSNAFTNTSNTTKIGSGQSDTALSGRLHSKQPFGMESATVGATYSAANFVSSVVLTRAGPTAAFSDTTPTAAQIVAAIPGCEAGMGYEMDLRNTTAFLLTLVAGTNVTLTGVTTVAATNTRRYRVQVTNAGAGSEAVTVFGISTASN